MKQLFSPPFAVAESVCLMIAFFGYLMLQISKTVAAHGKDEDFAKARVYYRFWKKAIKIAFWLQVVITLFLIFLFFRGH